MALSFWAALPRFRWPLPALLSLQPPRTCTTRMPTSGRRRRATTVAISRGPRLQGALQPWTGTPADTAALERRGRRGDSVVLRRPPHPDGRLRPRPGGRAASFGFLLAHGPGVEAVALDLLLKVLRARRFGFAAEELRSASLMKLNRPISSLLVQARDPSRVHSPSRDYV